jgi:UDP-GlcNAc:undecaprenyl-phosphate GlcNAc-1-phosphate transferase
LASGASIFALLSLFICSLSQGHPVVSLMSVVLAGAALGFLRYNFNPATIFLGDSGSLLLGFMAAALSLSSAQKGATMVAIAIPLVSFGLPITEVSVSILRRFLSGQPLFQSDSRHIHHMLLRRGWNHRQTVILLYAVCALFALFGLMLLNPRRNMTAIIFLVIGLGITLGVQHLRYVEFNALRCKLAGGLSRLRRALAAEIKVQRGRSELRQAENADQLFAALTELLQASDFDSMTLEVGEPEPTRSFKGNLVAVSDPAEWQWNWVREVVSLTDVFASSRYWSLRIPLCAEGGVPFGTITCYRNFAKGAFATDLAQVCGLLQRELSFALQQLQRRNQIVFQPSPMRLSLPDRSRAGDSLSYR